MTPPFESDECRTIDQGIRRHVSVLWNAGIETTESCEGGDGHSFPEPTVRFLGGQAEGFRALAVAMQEGLNVSELRRCWNIQNGEPHGPIWELTFHR